MRIDAIIRRQLVVIFSHIGAIFFFFFFFFCYSACNRNVWQLKVSCSVAHSVTVVVTVVVFELKTGLSHEIRPPTTWTSATILYKCSNAVKHSKSNCRVTCYNTFMTLKSGMKSLHYSYKNHLLYYRDFVSLILRLHYVTAATFQTTVIKTGYEATQGNGIDKRSRP